jgi:hypothetical protein
MSEFPMRWLSHAGSPVLPLALCAVSALSSAAVAAPARPQSKSPAPQAAARVALPLAGWSYTSSGMDAEDELEEAWAWRSTISASAPFEARVVLHRENSKYLLLRVQGSGERGQSSTWQFWRVQGGKAQPLGPAVSQPLGPAGELSLARSAWQVSALWNGRVVTTAWSEASGGGFGTSVRGGAKLASPKMQPTEAVVFSDDFMRAAGPDEPETPGSWQRTAGVWKTSGLLGPRADAALNPNPFVYRAENTSSSPKDSVASVGHWFWRDYALAASVKPTLRDAKAPLVAGLGAYGRTSGGAFLGVRGEVDFRTGRASLKRGSETLVQSAPFNVSPNEWHRLYLEPGPGTIRLLVDGVERARVSTSALPAARGRDFGQGNAALLARVSGGNFVDFDDVRAWDNPALSDDLGSDAPGRWDDVLGSWRARTEGDGQRITARGGASLTLTGSSEREEGLVEATFAPVSSANSGTALGAAFAARDAKNFFVARLRGSMLEIVQVSAGAARVLASAKVLRPMAASSVRPAVSVQWSEGVITARASGAVAVATVASVPTGRVGAWAQGGAGAVALTDFRALGAAPGWGEGALPARFTKDRLMKNWASNAAAWKRGEDGTFWHTGDFYGDSALTLPLPELPEGAQLSLRLGADPARANSGARLNIARQKNAWLWSLSQDGKPLQAVTLSDAQWPDAQKSVRFVRRPLEAGRASLRAVANNHIVFSEVAQSPASTSSGAGGTLKMGLLWTGPGMNVQGPPGRLFPVTLSTAERDKRAVVGVQLTELTEEAQKELSVPDMKGAVVGGIEPDTPAAEAGLLADDVIRAIDGKPVQMLEDVITAVQAKGVGAKVELQIWRKNNDRGPLDWEKITASTSQTLDYTFTGAPVDWQAASGRWEVAERWTCSPQWAFFVGSNAAAPTLWSRFATRGDWTMEAYLATPMDLTRSERSPADLNLTVGGDGRNLSSGYSFVFSGERQSVNRVYRGDAVALEKPYVPPSLLGNHHQDWFYVRLERRQVGNGVRFQYFVNNRLTMEYTDANPLPKAGSDRFAFWTYNGGLSIARARLWYSGLAPSASTANKPLVAEVAPSAGVKNVLGEWAPRRESVLTASARVLPVSESGRSAVKITNAQSGGDWTTYVSRKPFDAAQKPWLSFDYRVPASVRVNLYVKVEDRWREIVFTGGGPNAPKAASAVAPAGAPIVPGTAPAPAPEVDTSIVLGSLASVVADNTWRRASFDLASALRRANLPTTVQEIAFAAPDRDYLRAGIGGNKLGATYHLANFNASTGAAGAPNVLASR